MISLRSIYVGILVSSMGLFLTGEVLAEPQFGGKVEQLIECTCGQNMGSVWIRVGSPHGSDNGGVGEYIVKPEPETKHYDCDPLMAGEWILGEHNENEEECKERLGPYCVTVARGKVVKFYGSSDNDCGSGPSSKSTDIVNEIKQKRDNGEEVVGIDISTPDADEDSKSIVVKVLSARDSGNEVSGTDIDPHPEATDKSRNVVEEIVQKRDNGEEVVGTDISTPEASNGSSSTVSSILASITSGSSSTSTISNTINSSSQNSSSNSGSSLSGQSSANNNSNGQGNGDGSNNAVNNGNLTTGNNGSNNSGVENGNEGNNHSITGESHINTNNNINNVNSNTNPTASALSTSLLGIGQGGDLKEVFRVVLVLVSIGIAGSFVYRAGSKSVKILFTKKIKK